MDSISFKAYLKREGQDVEVRRFGIDGGAAASLVYLRGKIQAIFPTIQNDHFTIFWQDSDMDNITIGSDEELIEALSSSVVRPVKIYINDKGNHEQAEASFSEAAGHNHPGVTCDGCNGPVNGNRYKCVTCSDFDLCSVCEASGKHQDHIMLRISTPFSQSFDSRLFRKAFGRHHKMAHHMQRRMRGATESPHAQVLTNENIQQSGCPVMSAVTLNRPRMGRIFNDFKGLIEYLGALGVPDTIVPATPSRTQAGANAGAGAGATASAATNAGAGTGAAASGAWTQPGQAASTQSQAHNSAAFQPSDCLDNVGQVIAAILDPLGIMKFDAHSNQNESQPAGQTPASPMTPAPVPAPILSPAPSPVNTTTAPAVSPVTFATPAQPTSLATEPPAMIQPVQPQSSPARRNSDDWTLLNRESPVRNDDVAMDVDNTGARSPGNVYPELPTQPATAPPQPQPATDPKLESQIQEAIERIRSMGFNFDNSVLYDLLKKENCNIASVVEMILSNKQ